MTEFSSGNAPGFRVKVESEEAQITWSGRNGQTLIATQSATIASDTTDAGNTPATTLRAGNVLATSDSDGKARVYDPDANDGSQLAIGLLEHHQDMLVDGVATDRFSQMLVHGLAKESQLVGLDPRAKAQLGSRFVFDGDLSPAGVLMHPRGVYRKSANYTLTADDNGLQFIATAAVNFTLPTKQNGLAYRFVQTADANLILTGSADLIHKGNAAATTVTFSTTSEKIGSHLLVECMYVAGSTLKWIVTNLGGTTATVA